MNPLAFFLVTSDPRTSGRPAEAVRIAAGVAAWKKVHVAIYFYSAAVLALGEFADELIDGDNYRQYLPVLADSGGKLFIQDSAALTESGKTMPGVQALSEAELAELTATSQYVLRF
jgi:hypothetical protein